MRWFEQIDREELIAQGVAAGFSEADVNLWFNRLLAARGAVRRNKISARLVVFNSSLDAITTQRNRALMGRQFVVDNAPDGAAKVATLATLDDGILRLNQQLAAAQAQVDALEGGLP